jgi:hypothetical protein
MVSGGFLRQPRVRVLWGSVNLSAYDGNKGFPQGSPLVYDVQVDLNAENEAPTATMKWDPTGPGFAVYESFINDPEYMKTQITVEYFYPQGKKVVFVFVWSGQTINYGNDMTVTINMTSELSGLINGNIRSTAQAYDEKTGGAPQDLVNRLQKQFGLEEFKTLVQYNQGTLDYWKKVKILNQYGNDWTFGNAVAALIKQTGDQAFPINISQASVVVMPPFSWVDKKKEIKQQDVEIASVLTASNPDPTKRYGYILGPSIINTMTRTSQWSPPQQSNENDPARQKFATNANARGRNTANPQPNSSVVAANKDGPAKPTSSPLGTSGGRASLSVQSKENPYGPDRQNALNQEKNAKLNFSTFLTPVLVGLKPHDILYIPSLSGEFIEDWIVQSVGYSAQNGGVEVSVQASRIIGLGTPMNEEAAKKFKASAIAQGLIGPNATLEAWERYAWG